MKNKEGFTLVELLAVIVILALIMTIAVISIGGILKKSKESTMKETAAMVIDGVVRQLIITDKLEEGDYYFEKAIVEKGLDKSPLNGQYSVGFDSCLQNNKIGDYLCKTVQTECNDKTNSYVRVTKDANNRYEYSICLTAGEGNYYIDSATKSDLLDNNNNSMIKKNGENENSQSSNSSSSNSNTGNNEGENSGNNNGQNSGENTQEIPNNPPELPVPTLSISPASGTVEVGVSITSTITTNSDGIISCISSNSSYATCSIENSVLKINGLAPGTATITINQIATDNYKEASPVNYIVTVKIPTCPGALCMYTKSSNKINRAIKGTYGVDYKNNYSGFGNYFLGHILDGTTIKESYACGINGGKIFCLRGGVDETSLTVKTIFINNVGRLNSAFSGCNAAIGGNIAYCNTSTIDGYVNYNGTVYVNDICYVYQTGNSSCSS